MTTLFTLLCMSTVYNRYHYVVDVIAGLLLGTLVMYAGAANLRDRTGGAIASGPPSASTLNGPADRRRSLQPQVNPPAPQAPPRHAAAGAGLAAGVAKVDRLRATSGDRQDGQSTSPASSSARLSSSSNTLPHGRR